MRSPGNYDGVVVCSPVTVPYVRFSEQPAHWWFGAALREIARRTGLKPGDVDGLCFSSFTAAPDTVVGLVQHAGLSLRWMDHIPTGGACGVMALRRAARAVQAGDAELIICVAADTNHVDSFRRMLSTFSRFSQDATDPYGFGGPNATFALIMDYLMRRYDIGRESFAKLCVAQRQNALANPYALMKKPLSIEQYMNARKISDPVCLFDCVMPCAGAEAFIVTTPETAGKCQLSSARLCATIERHNAFKEDPVQYRGGWAKDVNQLWDSAELQPADIDAIQLYDDYPVIVAMQMEDLGFCEKGRVADFIEANTFTVSGSLPLNTNGGQLSAGQAGTAGGYQNITEALRQVLHCPLGDQVAEAKYALASGFGMVNYDRGICSGAAIFETGQIL